MLPSTLVSRTRGAFSMGRVVDVLLVLVILAIVLTLVVPGSPNSSPRSKIAEASLYASGARGHFADLCRSSKIRPGIGLAELEMWPPPQGSPIARAELSDREGREFSLRITLHEVKGAHLGVIPFTAIPEGRELIFSFKCIDRELDWRLSSTTVEAKFLPASLR